MVSHKTKHNNWLNLTAGAMRFSEFCRPHKVICYTKVPAPLSRGRLAKTSGRRRIENHGYMEVLRHHSP